MIDSPKYDRVDWQFSYGNKKKRYYGYITFYNFIISAILLIYK